MIRRRRIVGMILLVLPLAAAHAAQPASEAKKAATGREIKVTGIMFDHDRQHHTMTVKADGEDEPVRYTIDPSNRRLAESLKTVFNASRVRLTYRMDGDSRRLVNIQRQVLQESGIVTGVVVKVHNDFWVELKPRKGVPDAFAPGANYNDKDFMAALKALKPGDSVTIEFTTDFERHRIMAMRKNAVPVPSGRKTNPQSAPAREKD